MILTSSRRTVCQQPRWCELKACPTIQPLASRPNAYDRAIAQHTPLRRSSQLTGTVAPATPRASGSSPQAGPSPQRQRPWSSTRASPSTALGRSAPSRGAPPQENAQSPPAAAGRRRAPPGQRVVHAQHSITGHRSVSAMLHSRIPQRGDAREPHTRVTPGSASDSGISISGSNACDDSSQLWTASSTTRGVSA